MAYAAMPAKVAGDTITLANYDNIRDNFAAGVPDIFTTKGDVAVATAADTATRVGVAADDALLVADSGVAAGIASQIVPVALVYNSSDIDPATGSWVTLTFDSERADAHACHSTVSNTGRLTVPTDGDGIYLIGGSVLFDSTAAVGRVFQGIRVRLNGATVIAEMSQRTYEATIDESLTISRLYSLAATDYVELQVYVEDDIDILAQGNQSPEFWFIWQRRAP